MSFCISFSKHRASTLERDLLIHGPGASQRDRKSTRIVVSINDARLVGRWDDKLARITTFVSGSLTSVPESLRPGSGVAAAEVLARLYTKYSTQAFAKIDGAFCGAILDWRRGAIIVGRDKLGIRRAYISRDGDTVTFSDSLSDLLDSERQNFTLDVDSVHTFLMIGWVPAPLSMFRGIEKLPPGTILESRDGKLRQTSYYDVPHSPSCVVPRSAENLGQEVAEQLDRSVDRGLTLGGRWGSFLSGGVDSSSVVSALARNKNEFPTYFGGFAPWLNRYLPNPEEPALSQLVSTKFGTNHRMLWLGPESIESVPEIVGALEEPVSDGGCIVLGAVMRAARNEVEGLMTGVGGDFLFTGERRHIVPSLLRLMRPIPDTFWHAAKWLSGAPLLARITRISQMHFDLTRLLAVRNLSIPEMYAGFFLQADLEELKCLFVPEVLARLSRDPLQEINAHFERASELDPLSQILYVDLRANVPDDLVREVETLGRHFGVHIYNPFLDADFVDFAMTIPISDKVSGLTLKVPLKTAMRGRVPNKILDRKKGGLGSPIRWWVSQSDGFVASVLSRRNLERRGMFSPDTVEQFRHATAVGARDHSKILWSLFTLELWLQTFID